MEPEKLGLSFLVLCISSLNYFSLVSGGGGFPKGFLNDITESDIVKSRLSSRWKWEVWDVVPGTHIFKLYLFNITNPSDVENNGKKPILSQVGPYTYIEHRIKFNISINLDLSVNYERNFTYTFDAKNSSGSENDLINIINVPFIIFSTVASTRSNSTVNQVVNKLVHENGETLIKRNVKVGDILFNGINVSVYKKYTELLGDVSSSLRQEFESGVYGILKTKRGAHEGVFTVESGLKSRAQLGRIQKWNGQGFLNHWFGPTCSKINGTDGSVFPPNLGKDSLLEIFDDDLCRSISFTFNSTTTYFGSIPVSRFLIQNNVLADPRKDSRNICFCKNPGINAGNCLKGGVLDVSSCKEGAPYIMSYPHFLDASPEYGQAVIGMAPNSKVHETSIDVEPRIGAVIQYKRRLQWNIRLQPILSIDYFSNMTTLVFPIAWNDDRFKLNDDKADLLVSELANVEGGHSRAVINVAALSIPFVINIVICGFLILD